MIQYGVGPRDNEIELVVFGPGFGEALALHLGEREWLLIDSCIDPFTRLPAAQAYFHAIHEPLANVKAIVASHWHDDHVRGISGLAQECPAAEFHFSAAFSRKEATAYVVAYSGAGNNGLSRGTQELFNIVRHRSSYYHTQQRSSVYERQSSGRRVEVTALSPVHAALARSVATLAKNLPSIQQPIKNAVDLSPNMAAVVLHVDLGDDDALLLGSDLEENSRWGWSAILADSWCAARKPSSVYKVAHHGSDTAHVAAKWTRLLRTKPHAVLTPFIQGNVRLPKDSDRQRIRNLAPSSFISSGASRRAQIDQNQQKRLGDIVSGLTPVNNGFGAVRIRKMIGAHDWSVECFGDAQPLQTQSTTCARQL